MLTYPSAYVDINYCFANFKYAEGYYTPVLFVENLGVLGSVLSYQ